MNIQANTVATVHYPGTLPTTEETFDTSRDRDPLVFLVGHQQMIPGFEREMMGASVGETRTFTLEPEDAYGQREEARLVSIPRGQFGDIPLTEGMQLMSDSGPFIVLSIGDEDVEVDFNHKLAGERLTFEVEVVSVREASAEEINHGHVHGPGGVQH